MDPLAAWVDLEPPLTAAGSGPAIAVRVGPVEEPLDGGASTHRLARASARGPAAAPSSSASLIDQRAQSLARCGARVGLCRGAARRRRVHPSVGARIGERTHGGAVARRAAECGAV
jgi:hypothetical protein